MVAVTVAVAYVYLWWAGVGLMCENIVWLWENGRITREEFLLRRKLTVTTNRNTEDSLQPLVQVFCLIEFHAFCHSFCFLCFFFLSLSVLSLVGVVNPFLQLREVILSIDVDVVQHVEGSLSAFSPMPFEPQGHQFFSSLQHLVCVCVCAYVHTCVWINVRARVCMCVHTYEYVYMY